MSKREKFWEMVGKIIAFGSLAIMVTLVFIIPFFRAMFFVITEGIKRLIG